METSVPCAPSFSAPPTRPSWRWKTPFTAGRPYTGEPTLERYAGRGLVGGGGGALTISAQTSAYSGRLEARLGHFLVLNVSGGTRPFRRRPDDRAELCTDPVHRFVQGSITASLTLPVGYLQCCISIYFHLTWTGAYQWNGERLTFAYLIGANSKQIKPNLLF